MRVSPVAAARSVTAREKISDSTVAHVSGLLRTATESSSGAVYSVVMADSVFGTIVELSRRWLDEKSIKRGVKGNSSSAASRMGRRSMFPGLMSPCTIDASLCIQLRLLINLEARLSQILVEPRTGCFMLDVVRDSRAICAHALMWSSRDRGYAAITKDDS